MEKDKPRSGVSGVCWVIRTDKWNCNIGIDGKSKYLGTFSNLDEAVLARYKAELELGRELDIGYSPAHKYLIKHKLLDGVN